MEDEELHEQLSINDKGESREKNVKKRMREHKDPKYEPKYFQQNISSSGGGYSAESNLEEHDFALDEDENLQKIFSSAPNSAATIQTDEEFNQYVEMMRGPPDGIENKISNSTLRKVLHAMSVWWSTPPQNICNEDGYLRDGFIKHAASRWGACADGSSVSEKLEKQTLTSVDLRYVYSREMFKRIRLDALLRQRGFLETAGDVSSAASDDMSGVGFAQDLGKIQECLSRAYQLLLADLKFRKSLDSTVDQGCPALADPFGYVPYTEGKLNDFQTYIIFILRALYDSNYRRYNGAVYEQIISPLFASDDGISGKHPTHAWKYVCEIKDFVISRTPKEDFFTQWQTMTTSNAGERVAQYLLNCSDPEFTTLYPNRMYHSFHNGIYNVEKQEFYKYGDERIPSDVVTCKYHDQMFDEDILKHEWFELKVPHLEEVIAYQYPITPHKKDDPACKNGDCAHLIHDEAEQMHVISWIYAFIGRVLYEVGQKDKWQVMPFIVGRAGTGKSLLLKCISHFYNKEDVEVLANKSQHGFGLETLVNKLLWLCYEVKNDFSLDQAQLQSMISGEETSVWRKNKTALSVLWKVPGFLAGNEVANWVDNSGSMSRRIVLSFWDRKVTADKVDPFLDRAIQNNIGSLLHKSASAYAAMCKDFASRDLWGSHEVDGKKYTILPKYFHVAKSKMQTLSDPLMAFLNSKAAVLVGESSTGMSWERFRSAANNFFQKENIKNFSWKETKFKSIFDDLGIKKFKIDEAFINSHGKDGIFLDADGNSQTLGTDWLLGVYEKDVKSATANDQYNNDNGASRGGGNNNKYNNFNDEM